MLAKFITTILIGTLGGILGMKLKIPAGSLFGAMLFSAVYNLVTDAGYVPPQVNTILQIAIGTAIGLNFNMANIKGLGSVMVSAVIMVAGLMAFSLLMGWAISRLTGMDLLTALFSSSPGGLSNIVIISEAYGAQAHIVALMHTLRIICVVVLMPIIVNFISRHM